MTQDEYLNILSMHIEVLPFSEREEIIADLKEHFDFARQEGHTDTDICDQLGSPIELAKQYTQGRTPQFTLPYPNQSRNQFAKPVTIPLTVFGILILAGPVIGIFATLGSLILTGALLILSSCLVIVTYFMSLTTGLTLVSMISLALGLFLSGIGLLWLNIFFIKNFTTLMTKTLKTIKQRLGGNPYVA